MPGLIVWGDELLIVRHLLHMVLNEYLIFLPLTPLKIEDNKLTSLPNMKKLSSFVLVKKERLQSFLI